MSRNIVICCDGTANEFAQHNTNVVKLYSVLAQAPATQVAYYHPGLGTLEPAGALTSFARAITKLLGRAIGYGLADDIRDCYVFLMRHYEPGDRVFLFGFSRGAYTVRAVASLLRMYGLIRPGNETLVPYAVRMLMGIKRAEGRRSARLRNQYFKLAASFKRQMSGTRCKPWFVGVWDTVSSVGWVENPLKLPFISDNPDIRRGRHAVAIDERRAFFRNHLWRTAARRKDDPERLQQVWFPGVHCDVGGGYPEPESGLSKVALQWMLHEAIAEGLLVDPVKCRQMFGARRGAMAPNPDGDAHESLRGAWYLAEVVVKRSYDWVAKRYRRRMNLGRRRAIPPGALVHESAYARHGGKYAARLPPDARVVATRSGGY